MRSGQVRRFAEYGGLLTGKSGADARRILKLLFILCPLDQYTGTFLLPDAEISVVLTVVFRLDPFTRCPGGA